MVWKVSLAKDKHTKENKGFAFVTFTGMDAAQRAIEDMQDREYKVATCSRCRWPSSGDTRNIFYPYS